MFSLENIYIYIHPSIYLSIYISLPAVSSLENSKWILKAEHPQQLTSAAMSALQAFQDQP